MLRMRHDKSRLSRCTSLTASAYDLHARLTSMSYLDSVPFSGIIRIRDMMYSVDRPFRLDQGDVSFDAPESVKAALIQGVHDNRTHYVQTTGIPPLLELLVDEDAREERHSGWRPRRGHGHLRRHPRRCSRSVRVCSSPATKCWCPIRRGRPRPATSCARMPCRCGYPLHESRGWRPDVDEMRAARHRARRARST